MDLHSLFETLRSYAPPYFFGTLVAGAFGAFAGAWAAGRVHTKRAIVAELNSISAALALCFSIRGLFIGLKKQHVRPLRDRFEQAKHEFQEATKGRKGPVIYTLLTDFQTMTPVRAPTEALERHVFEKISLRGRALVAAVTLVGAIDGLDKSIKYRNDLIAEIQKKSPVPNNELVKKYFGLPTSEGIIDERFPMSIDAIYNQTDDCISFAGILADDLLEYEAKLRRRHRWKLYWLGVPKSRAADWSLAETEGLIPPTEQYAAWLKGFKKEPTKWALLKSWLRAPGKSGKRDSKI